MKSKKTPYLTSAQLAEALEESQKQGRPTEQVCQHFKMIATHMLGDTRFRSYSKHIQEDLESAALVKCIKNIKNYKPEFKAKCFNYFTRCVEHAFFDVLSKMYRQRNLERQLALDYADQLEAICPQAADQIRQEQIVVEHTKDKVRWRGRKA